MAQFLAAIVVLCAAWLMPSLASAHANHSHHSAVVTDTTIAPAAEPADTASPVTMPRTKAVRATATASIVGAAVDGGDGGCASHCCGAAAGMTCCGAALAPETNIAPAFTGSQLLRFERVSAPLGLPAEALPKPPKSFA